MANSIGIQLNPALPQFSKEEVDIRIAPKPGQQPKIGDIPYALGFKIGKQVKISKQLRVLGEK